MNSSAAIGNSAAAAAGTTRSASATTTSLQGGKFVWSTGNTGEEGFFNAVVAPKPRCKGASSPTVHAVRNDD